MSFKEQTQDKDTIASKKQSADLVPSPSSESLPLGASVQRAQPDPRLLSPKKVLQLQRMVGNQAVQRRLTSLTTQRASKADDGASQADVAPFESETEDGASQADVAPFEMEEENGAMQQSEELAGAGSNDLVVQCVRGPSQRPAGVSERLAGNTWKHKKRPKNLTYKQWKQGYEAQHIIPWAVANKLGLPMKEINEHWNCMMLPSGRKNAKPPVFKAKHGQKFYNRPRHIKRGIAHPRYNQQVELYIREQKKKYGMIDTYTMKQIAGKIRAKTKMLSHNQAVDDIRLV